MMQTGRQFCRRREFSARGFLSSVISKDAGLICLRLSSFRRPWDAAVEICPTARPADSSGKAHDPFALMADPSKPDFKVPDLLPPENLGEVRIARRRKLRDLVDATVKDFESTENAAMMAETSKPRID